MMKMFKIRLKINYFLRFSALRVDILLELRSDNCYVNLESDNYMYLGFFFLFIKSVSKIS